MKKTPRQIKMELKRQICETYGLPIIPCSRWGTAKSAGRKDLLKGMLWHVFSKYIRMRDAGQCISCGRFKEYEELQAGHYAPVGGNDIELCFDEHNVNGECSTCNADFEGGGWHLVPMRKMMIYKWGQKEVDRIDKQKDMRKCIIWEEQEYVDRINKYLED